MSDQHNENFCSINGVLTRSAQATVSIHDRGFLYGDGLFETIPVYQDVAFALEAHLQRLLNGVAALRINHAPSTEELTRWIDELIAANGGNDGVLRIALSRGQHGAYGLGCSNLQAPTVVITWSPPRRYAPASYREGIALHVSDIRHPSPAMLPTRFKHANYLVSILAYDDAIRHGAAEALLLNEHGRICEGAFSNIFFVRDDVLLTPALEEGALAGITRQIVIDIAQSSDVRIIEDAITTDILEHGDECFITNSNAGLLPVRNIGEHEFAAPGSMTRILSERYWQKVLTQAGRPWFEF